MDAIKRDPMNIGCSHPGACELADSVAHVKTATPLANSKSGYVIASPDTEPEFYAAAHAIGGETVRAYKSITIETYEKNFRPGDRLDIAHIDDFGNLYFERSANGPYSATSDSAVYLDTTQWLLRKGIALARERSKRDGEQVRDVRQHEAQHSEPPKEGVLDAPKPPKNIIEGW